MNTITIEVDERELFAIVMALKYHRSRKQRHRFGVSGLGTRLYDLQKERVSGEAYESMRAEWKAANPFAIPDNDDDLEPED